MKFEVEQLLANDANRPLQGLKRVALVGGFTPVRCGIATFTADIYGSLTAASPEINIDVYAMTPEIGAVEFDAAVSTKIVETDPTSFIAAAHAINASRADVVWLQHEFGIFGGQAGAMILELVDRISAPLVVTTHTVIDNPDPAQLWVMRRLVARASKLMVMSERSCALLTSVYGADPGQIVVIPHGVPDRPFGRSSQFKKKFGFEGRAILMTFGLLSPGKGIEAVISALPAVVASHPEALYCIVGATHPKLIAHEGEAYRKRLMALATSLGVEDNIHWIDAFLDTEELLDLIEAADIYITPYPGAAQSTSGTLSYAVALGKAVISTPYVHATELLANDHGILVPFNDSNAICREVQGLLDSPARLLALQTTAYERGRAMVWSAFAERCIAMLDEVRIKPCAAPSVQRLPIAGLLRICDDTGILQHSVHNVPDRAHGYCIDDNARALMLTNRLGNEMEPDRSRLSSIFAAFVQNAWNEDVGQFRNFMGFGRNWLEDFGSEDSCGRTIWALGATALEGRTVAIRRWARGLFNRTSPSALAFGSPRAKAFAMLGAEYMLKADPAHALAFKVLTDGTDYLMAQYAEASSAAWPWFETMLAYDNFRLPEAMMLAGERVGRADVLQHGIDSMHWLYDQQVAPAGHFRPIGSDSFGRALETPRPFDQQPVEVWAAVDACAVAYNLTSDLVWLTNAQRAYDWFGGGNDRGAIVGDPVNGTCHDGINPRGVNFNEGAESVLAYQLANCTMRDLFTKTV